MTGPRRPQLPALVYDGPEASDEFVADSESVEALEELAQGLVASHATPSAKLLERVLRSTRDVVRFERFVADAAALLDLPQPEARALLERLEDPEAWEPGFLPELRLCHVRGGAKVANAVTGFVQLTAEQVFPEHEHLGEESVLVLQGRFRDGDDVYGPGAVVVLPPGSSHSFTALPGPDLLYLAVVQAGVRVGDQVMLPDDPRA